MDRSTLDILLIEDHPTVARVMKKVVERAPGGRLRLEAAGSLETGLDRLAAGGIDAILLDLALPDSDGLATVAAVQARAPEVPIVVLTGRIDDAIAAEAVQQGAQDYLIKGEVDDTALVHAVRYAVERKRAERCQAAESAVTRILAESAGLDDAIPRALAAIGKVLGWDVANFWTIDERTGLLHCVAGWQASCLEAERFDAVSRHQPLMPGLDLPGRVWESGRPRWIDDVAAEAGFLRAAAAAEAGLHGAFCVPVRPGDETLAVVEFFRREAHPPDSDLLRALDAVVAQLGHYIRRRRAEEAIAESQARTAAILAAAPTAIIAVDRKGTIQEFNPAARRLFGFEPAEALGRELAEFLIPPAGRDEHRRRLSRHLGPGQAGAPAGHYEFSALRLDGPDVRLVAEIAPLPPSGAVLFLTPLPSAEPPAAPR